ncbi:DUF2182 domain-containing protein [Haladaptatus salinisoli]|uniref:copper chaperone n=1 Tax=Haladaptatus salinisoli TaxID=2884876 RepID=UPI001D0BB26A|nr:DUF2182 domain-containing protein [Haladaptatus salinisoli]
MSAEVASERRFALADRVDRTTAVVVAMVALDALWWTLLFTGRVPMLGMTWLANRGIPMAAPGAMELAAFHAGTSAAFAGYVVTWGVMMMAMMYPPMTRFTRDYADALRGSTAVVAATVVAFHVGYGVVWLFSGVVPLGLHALLPGGIYGFAQAHTRLAVGGALALTGCYQLTGFKRSRLRTCCSRVLPHNARVADGLRKGVEHGVSCLLVCLGPFFLVMPFFGEMNYFWMVALTTVVTVERLPAAWGREFSVATGLLSLAAGVVVLFLGPPLPIGFAT